MDENFLLGVLVGFVGLGLSLAATHRTYRRTLQHCADCESAEKLPDGHFYYLVREDRYGEMQRAALAARWGSAPQPLTDEERATLERIEEDFADCGETEVPHDVLMGFAARGYLECERFIVTNKAQRERGTQGENHGG